MNVRESVRISWRSITAHKLRSTLTTLGVIIGVAAVITFMVLGAGFTADIVGGLEEYDEPAMVVWTQTTPEDGFGIMPVETPIYTEHDIEQLESIEGVEFAAPMGTLAVTQTAVDGDRITGVVSVTASTHTVFTYDEFVAGAPFQSGEAEAVINTHVTHLFDGGIEKGDEIELTFADGSTETVTVVGIIEEPEELMAGPTVYVPTDPYYPLTIETPRGTTERAYASLMVGAETAEDLNEVRDAVIAYLEGESDASELKQDTDQIAVQTVEDAIEQVTDIVGQLTGFIAGIAAIALVVGSIGIANIMIVSVTERTREIGIMKAVGAKRRDIIQVFLVESAILGLIGAFFGVLLGLGVGYLGTSVLGWQMVYPLDWVMIAVAVGVSVGLIAGIYPAWRAAKIDPIEALRYE